MNKKIWLSPPHMSGNEMKYIQEAFNTNWIAPLGPNVNEFENTLQSYLGANNFAAALSSGTAAIHLGLILAGVKQGDEVLCQSFTFSASANPIVYQGATPVFIDSEADTWNMCPIVLENAILDRLKKGKKPKAIIVVDSYGMPAKWDQIIALAKKYSLFLIEDAASALGSTYKNQKCGTFGDIGVLSLNGNKIITTSGGGALVAKTKEIKDKAVFFATQSRDNAPHYQHSEIGYNYRMSNILAGIGRGQMEVLNDHIALRRAMHNFYVTYFKDTKGVTVFTEPNTDYFSNHWLTAILVNPEETGGKTREDLRLALDAANIESRPLWKPMHLQPIFANDPYYGGALSESLFQNGLCLPSGSNLTNEDRDRIKLALDNFFSE
ncbi:MAG: pyridoxal phosphate-dependent aminotransferase [Flavobacteria bacterium RIFCSPLOWO2_12_FULL_35_11]|nr:MAG: pyridoxal phosphate-dependent aminotransferase [Flavobacteria bacterium RIFCSPLOWO2_12_FULL_35_11]